MVNSIKKTSVKRVNMFKDKLMVSKENKKLILGVLLTFIVCISSAILAAYSTGPEFDYPNPGHHPGEIGPGTFNASGESGAWWYFPEGGIYTEYLKVYEDLNVSGDTQLGDSSSDKVKAYQYCDETGANCHDASAGWPTGGGGCCSLLDTLNINSDASGFTGTTTLGGDLDVSGKITKTGYVKGDCDKNGIVNMEDVDCISNYVVDNNNNCDDLDCDINNDGNVEIGDAMFLAQILLDLRNPIDYLPYDSIASISPYAKFTAHGNSDALTSNASGSNAYAGHFIGGKGVKIEGDLDVSGEITTSYAPLQGDINKDGYVNSLDLKLVGEEIGCQSGQSCWTSVIGVDNLGNKLYGSDLDLNGDDEVNVLDLILLTDNYENYKDFKVESENDDAIKAFGSGSHYSGFFTGGKGVKVEGDLDVSGDLIKTNQIVGDADNNDVIDGDDLVYMGKAISNVPGYSCTVAICDITNDGVVNMGDITLLLNILYDPTTFLPGSALENNYLAIGVLKFKRFKGHEDNAGIYASGDKGYAAEFTGGKGVKIEGDLDVSGILKGNALDILLGISEQDHLDSSEIDWADLKTRIGVGEVAMGDEGGWMQAGERPTGNDICTHYGLQCVTHIRYLGGDFSRDVACDVDIGEMYYAPKAAGNHIIICG